MISCHLSAAKGGCSRSNINVDSMRRACTTKIGETLPTTVLVESVRLNMSDFTSMRQLLMAIYLFTRRQSEGRKAELKKRKRRMRRESK